MLKLTTIAVALLLHSFVVLAASTNTFPGDGNVGIGTLSPIADLYMLKQASVVSLQVQNSQSDGTSYVMTGSTAGNTSAVLRSFGPTVTGQLLGNPRANSSMIYSNHSPLIFGTADNHHVAFSTNDSEKMRITQNGNVGIGTNSPTAKLTVIGTISAKEVKVTATGFPDYVFADDYKLRTLDEVEAHIKQHKHLPGIPSAAEVERDGLALSDISKKQMEKIEELTLYMIELKKQNEELKKSNNQLIKRVEALEQK